jgi:2-polyprenyl-3-methyl-5-hydroxy-6-metoxy-1,4-benzoquinol methylase
MHSNAYFQDLHNQNDRSKYEKPFEIARSNIIKELIPNGHGKLAVDIGSGPGYFSMMLANMDWKTIAIDSDSKSLEKAKRYAVETYSGNAIDVLLKLQYNLYDLALALEIIEHMSKAQGELLLNNVLKVLKPGGKLIISTPNKLSATGLKGYYWREKVLMKGKWDAWDRTHVHIYSSLEILRLVKSCGFTVDRIIGYYYGLIPLFDYFGLRFRKFELFPLNRFGFITILECHRK